MPFFNVVLSGISVNGPGKLYIGIVLNSHFTWNDETATLRVDKSICVIESAIQRVLWMCLEIRDDVYGVNRVLLGCSLSDYLGYICLTFLYKILTAKSPNELSLLCSSMWLVDWAILKD